MKGSQEQPSPMLSLHESWHLLRRSMEPPAVSTTYDLGSAHFSLTVPLNHVFDGLSMTRIGCPGYNGGSADVREVLLYDVIILARWSSNRLCTPSSRFLFVCDGRHVATRLFSNSSAGDGNFASIGVARIWSSACGILSDVFKHFFITGLTHLICLSANPLDCA